MDNDKATSAVLIVEDDQGCLDLIAEVVRDVGYEALICERIDEALKIIETRPIRLVILDVMLPDGDGFKILEVIRFNPATASMPVLLCTAALFEVTAYRKPINDPLTELVAKPFHIDHFIEVIERMLA
jgi:DNA-binding response OmpR family regulator